MFHFDVGSEMGLEMSCHEVQYKNIKFQASDSELRSTLKRAAVLDSRGVGPGWADKHPAILEALRTLGILWDRLRAEQN
jgi:hypothetical protein